jgi:hypothetical protein
LTSCSRTVAAMEQPFRSKLLMERGESRNAHPITTVGNLTSARKRKFLAARSFLYAFVDFNWGQGEPNIFIVPSYDVKKKFEGTSYARNMFWIMASDKPRYFMRWDYISVLMNV